ncbi:gp147 [Bacillus phage G]|uniref:Gp147 n=1 Tax=Bacillus phage G TaxID=2884420 RepID=G3MBL3_9CAUD|nr:gp147 [Bacillus phage G]AEO93946.1 gp147 [Bacillus phage G]
MTVQILPISFSMRWNLEEVGDKKNEKFLNEKLFIFLCLFFRRGEYNENITKKKRW